MTAPLPYATVRAQRDEAVRALEAIGNYTWISGGIRNGIREVPARIAALGKAEAQPEPWDGKERRHGNRRNPEEFPPHPAGRRGMTDAERLDKIDQLIDNVGHHEIASASEIYTRTYLDLCFVRRLLDSARAASYAALAAKPGDEK